MQRSAPHSAGHHRLRDRKGRPGRIRACRPARSLPDRRTALSRLLPCWPHELEDESAHGRQHIAERLRRALRAERQRGLAGHWTYDLARHIELLRLYRAEVAALAQEADARRCNTASDAH